MRRVGNLWEAITDFGNLLEAYHAARKGKRYRPSVLAFQHNLEGELLALQEELQAFTYQPGTYHQFWIHDPKHRLISAAPFRDRVIHHALCRVIGPHLERSFVGESFANRTGKGTHKALAAFTGHLRSTAYVLQCDIKQYFPSMDHGVLKALIRRRIKCPQTLWLIDRILDAAPPQPEAIAFFPGDDLFSVHERRRGLPIGNLTSQIFANVFLDGFDHFVKQGLGVGKYVRYVDDFALFHPDRAFLRECLGRIRQHLAGLRLVLNEGKTHLAPTQQGACFVGWRVLPDRIRVRSANLRRGRLRLRHYQALFHQGSLSLEDLSRRLQSWVAHLAHGQTWRLREKLFGDFVFTSPRKGGGEPREPWRQFQQQRYQHALGEPQQQHARQPEQQHRVPGSGCREYDPLPEFAGGIQRSAPGASSLPSWGDS
jgi:retron-type reverse transcriptase